MKERLSAYGAVHYDLGLRGMEEGRFDADPVP